MKINEIFAIDKYDAAYKFVSAHQGTMIKDLGSGRYQITVIPKPTAEQMAEVRRAERCIVLEKTDKWMLPDYPLTDKQREFCLSYRQYLRDVPEQDGFPETEIKTFDEWIALLPAPEKEIPENGENETCAVSEA